MHPDVAVDPDLRIDVRGEELAATRFRPTHIDESAPGILWITPYPKERERFGRYGPMFEYLAGHGYEVVLANLAGTGASTGKFHGLTSSETSQQCHALVDWLADRPWTTDRVGSLGKSAAGYACFATAAADPDPLAVAIPIMAPARSRRAIYAPSGHIRIESLLGWVGLFGALVTEPPNRREAYPDWRKRWHTRLDAIREDGPRRFGFPGIFTAESADAYWSQESPIEEISVPTLSVAGVRDTFVTEMLDIYDRIDAPKQLLLGPWRHIMPHRGRESAIDFRREAVDWFDQFLKGEDCGVLEGPSITYWTERDGGREVDGGTWRGTEHWPTADSAVDPVTVRLGPAGLTTDELDEEMAWTYEFDQTVGPDSKDYGGEFHDTNPDDARSLVFETAPFETPFEWTGQGRLTLQLESSTVPASVEVRVVDVAPNGRARSIGRGAQRLGSGPESLALDADEPAEVEVVVGPTSHVLEPDHRLRLAIAAADFPRHHPVGSHGEFRIRSGPDETSRLVLPARYRPGGFEDTVEWAVPDDSLRVEPPGVADFEASGTICRSRHEGPTTAQREVQTLLDLPHVDRLGRVEYDLSVMPDDPLSAAGRSTYETQLRFDNDPVTVTAEASITKHERRLAVEATVGESVALDQTWTTEGWPIL